MARMHGAGPGDVQKDRKGFVSRTAITMNAHNEANAAGAVVVLKGADTLVCDGRRLYSNTTGNPGMASGGSGDVLTGLIAALVGQGLSLFEAATAGVYVHGLAGDIAAEDMGQPSLIATDLIDYLPDAFDEWLGR
jgi:NAD(P)H-hydrate epimerase